MAAFGDVYATVALMQAVVPTNDGQIATVWQNGKAVTYIYRTAAAAGAANAGWYRTSGV